MTFDDWLGKVIDDAARPFGGRAKIAEWIGISPKTAERKGRGESPYLVREVEIIASHVNESASKLASDALSKYGGIAKLLREEGGDQSGEGPSSVRPPKGPRPMSDPSGNSDDLAVARKHREAKARTVSSREGAGMDAAAQGLDGELNFNRDDDPTSTP